MTEQTQPTDALLPCPFCGAAAHFEMDEGRWEWVECESCGMQGNRSASLMDDCKPKLAEEWNRRTPPALAPWRSAVLDLIDDCPGLMLEQDHWLSRRVKELDFASTPQPTQAQAATCKHGLHVVAWVIPDGKGGGQFSWEEQDERVWTRLTAHQTTQAQAGAVPLTVEEINHMAQKYPAVDLCIWSYSLGVADAERHHGITAHGVADMKGGQDG